MVSSASQLSRELILAILIRENELRLSPDTQRRFQEVSKQPDGWLGVVEQLQLHVAKEFHLPDHVALQVMRDAESLLPMDVDLIQQISLYRKYNRCIDGNLQVGQLPPDATIIDIHQNNHKEISLHSLLPSKNDTLPLVIFAGSYT